jgi:hypothetical protein
MAINALLQPFGYAFDDSLISALGSFLPILVLGTAGLDASKAGQVIEIKGVEVAEINPKDPATPPKE